MEKNNMEFVGLTAVVAVITVVICAVVKSVRHSGNGTLSKERALESAFGSHTYMDLVKTDQITEWVKGRKGLLNNGAKALVMKVTQDYLKKIGVKVNLDNVNDNYLVVAIVEADRQKMKDSILIKYGNLDEQLEQMLAKGDGMLVING